MRIPSLIILSSVALSLLVRAEDTAHASALAKAAAVAATIATTITTGAEEVAVIPAAVPALEQVDLINPEEAIEVQEKDVKTQGKEEEEEEEEEDVEEEEEEEEVKMENTKEPQEKQQQPEQVQQGKDEDGTNIAGGGGNNGLGSKAMEFFGNLLGIDFLDLDLGARNRGQIVNSNVPDVHTEENLVAPEGDNTIIEVQIDEENPAVTQDGNTIVGVDAKNQEETIAVTTEGEDTIEVDDAKKEETLAVIEGEGDNTTTTTTTKVDATKEGDKTIDVDAEIKDDDHQKVHHKQKKFLKRFRDLALLIDDKTGCPSLAAAYSVQTLVYTA
ncbi:hypothetical protein BGZ65_011628 [Modicella reniformis]|uniref:Uncharacterized protein n=1 Tax=Modicella reniformis TaxID=1440133 RepID=A0A9P6JI67_9FUNG|nr:hypothetical protein BGZ65_011628 [Modicella reniformis]